MPLVKVCGIRTKEAALKAAESGADFVGLVFAKSRRQITLEEGAEIVRAIDHWHASPRPRLQPPKLFEDSRRYGEDDWFHPWARELEGLARRPLVVGVFSNQTAEEINKIATNLPLDLVQLHGDERLDEAGKICVPVIRAIHVGEGDTIQSVKAQIIPGHYAFVLLDSKVTGAAQQGGSGVPFDWTIAHALRSTVPFLVAGGLNPENVEEAIQKIGPWGVDVSSGVETEGVKDLEKVRGFVERGKMAIFETNE
jgi:phosphoribosylanthranilate isomerase